MAIVNFHYRNNPNDEVHMKLSYKTAVTAVSLFALCTSAGAAADRGIDNKVEWFTKTSWELPAKPVRMVHSLDGKRVYVLGDDSKVHVLSPVGKLLGSIEVDEGVVDIDIAPYGEQLFLVNTKDNTFTNLSVSLVAELSAGTSPFKGPKDAPVTITLFTDFECPYCRKLPPIIDKILEHNPKTVKLVLKNLPLRMHPMAEPAARAALAAHEQGKFWEFHDKLFAQNKITHDGIENIALSLGLDMDKFKKGMTSPEVKAQVNRDMLMAQKAGVTGTPTSFINGRKVQDRSIKGYQNLIDEELAKLNNK